MKGTLPAGRSKPGFGRPEKGPAHPELFSYFYTTLMLKQGSNKAYLRPIWTHFGIGGGVDGGTL